ncbi:cytochrome c oxidase subunit II [Paenibacillus larvae subsp. pulvifaciens]|uniref:Cytochrome c oxidase subunit 2 n=2 Tax=Paenibacillus larvae TaxID=1464 RepID=A0A1V0URV8_9BACL|nr:cytochrome c oxidase subunit II [Paenibacillus larvae]AQT84608.1 cytochrome c oxidase subunit II [Paenibacillus larvae subsp. pulvifaciens]AQZ46608.1 cytochrome c oxidase subunit II [Paenibacillus larvae subsp. pulvifaciens]ARF68019.1 cytochrome c oxidase subunit II [Paenibacillus larvae subsp. pulvifaciens]MBH0341586.1 cytochrome b [Paenibacillus larvae]MCY7521082.1 cytochrome c oxidase subunit II [Paenibacillus larvae]
MSRWKMLKRLIPLFAVMTFLLSGCGDPTMSALKPKGPVAQEQYYLMLISISIMVLVIVVVFALYLYVIIRFRKRKGQEDIIPKQVEGNHILEIVWTVIPIVLLIILAVPTINYTFKHSANNLDNKDAIQVKVTASQFWWKFEYPELGIKTAQDLVIPVGKKIAFEIVSNDVVHSFWVPSLGGKIDANPSDLKTVYTLQADEAGVYKGKCAELCGPSHALMDFKVDARSEEDFNAWVQKMKTPVATVAADAQKGEEIFKSKCLSCHAVEADKDGMGPNLKGFADRQMVAGVLEHNEKNLKDWIKDPVTEKMGTKMPTIPLQDQEIDELVKYLNTLK